MKHAVTRRHALLAAGGTALAMGGTGVAFGDESSQQILASHIPKKTQLIGLLGRPLCQLVSFRGVWSVAYDGYVKDRVPHLSITSVDGADCPVPPVLPGRLVNIVYQTTGLETEPVLEKVREGDVWAGLAFETAEIAWVPVEVFQLPGVVPWPDGRPMSVVSRINCVDVAFIAK